MPTNVIRPITELKNEIVDLVMQKLDEGTLGGYCQLCVGSTEAATIVFNATRAFAASSGGSGSMNSTTDETSATGNASPVDTAKFFDDNDKNWFDGDADTASAVVNLTTTTIPALATVSFSTGTAATA